MKGIVYSMPEHRSYFCLTQWHPALGFGRSLSFVAMIWAVGPIFDVPAGFAGSRRDVRFRDSVGRFEPKVCWFRASRSTLAVFGANSAASGQAWGPIWPIPGQRWPTLTVHFG